MPDDSSMSHAAEPELVRLQKFLARSGVDSRRHCEALIEAGRVSINGEVRTEMGVKVNPLCDIVEVDGKRIMGAVAPVTIMLNKPAGYITAMSDEFGHDCIAQLVPVDTYPGLFPLGRLDAQTTGLLLFSTDGELGSALLHPSHHVTKLYEALVEGCVTGRQAQQLRDGVMLGDGITQPAEATIVSADDRSSLVHLGIHEGRNRQVRRMMKAVGHPVIELKRLSFGPIDLGDLPLGEWRILNDDELAALYGAAGK